MEVPTVEPRDGDALEEDEEQQAHAAGRVVIKQLEHVQASLETGNKKSEINQVKMNKMR